MSAPSPLVTVVMPVFNALPFLDRAISSITEQTLTDLRLAIYDDHSTDGSYERALEWAQRDQRISVTRGTHRLGPSDSSQAAAQLATSDYVARMDADDLARPDRLAVQLAVMDANPQAVLVGSAFDMIDGEDRLIRAAGPTKLKGPTPPIAHASIFYRRAAFDAAGGYRTGTDYFEDQDLYRRMNAFGQLLVMDAPLIQLRFAGQHARLRDDRVKVLERIDRHYRSGSEAVTVGSHSIAPLAFYSLGVLAIMALERPMLLGLMLRRARFEHPGQTLAIMAFLGLADLSPRLARGVNGLMGRLRAGRGGGQAQSGVRVWHLGSGKAMPVSG